THEWFMKNVLEPLENAKAAISEAMYDILPKYKADMERLGIKKGSKESAAVMYYGEGVTADGNPYTLDNLKQDFPSTWKNIVEADRINRRMYDDYVDKINRIAWIVLHFCAEAVRPSGVIPVQDECGFSSTHSIYRL
ncbi:MAG: hypothetical protein VB021_07995, partial [Oscillospiraceae bacterium]|nr:hypothetical protein [Oscillospiraceae bacterium]